MKFNRLPAEFTIFQGTITQPPIIVVSMTPRRIEMYLGQRDTMSFEQDITLAERLTPI